MSARGDRLRTIALKMVREAEHIEGPMRRFTQLIRAASDDAIPIDDPDDVMGDLAGHQETFIAAMKHQAKEYQRLAGMIDEWDAGDEWKDGSYE